MRARARRTVALQFLCAPKQCYPSRVVPVHWFWRPMPIAFSRYSARLWTALRCRVESRLWWGLILLSLSIYLPQLCHHQVSFQRALDSWCWHSLSTARANNAACRAEFAAVLSDDVRVTAFLAQPGWHMTVVDCRAADT